jgi:hypothetical protein
MLIAPFKNSEPTAIHAKLVIKLYFFTGASSQT